MRSTTLTKMSAKSGSRASAHSLEGHSHEVGPGGTTADRAAEMDQKQFPLPEGPYRAPS